MPISIPMDTKSCNYDFTGLYFWERLTGFFSLAEAVALQALVKQQPPDSVIVELGAFRGKSSIAIAAVLPPGAVLHSIDHFEGALLQPGETRPPMDVVIARNKEAFLRNIAAFGVAGRIQLHVMRTVEAAALFDDNSLALVFVDAGHDYESVMADIAAWHPKLKAGGYMMFDDYEEKWPGVVQAVRDSSIAGELIAPSLWCHRKP